MAKQKFKITNWHAYNKAKAFRLRDSLTVWLDQSAMAVWTDSAQPEGPGRPLHCTGMAITTVLMMKRVFNLSLRALPGFVDSIFTLTKLPLRCPISKRAKTANISIKTPAWKEITHLAIDFNWAKGFWRRRAESPATWYRQAKSVVEAPSGSRQTHEIVCADLSLSGTTDRQILPGLINMSRIDITLNLADMFIYPFFILNGILIKKIDRRGIYCMISKTYQYFSTKENIGVNLCRISIAIVFMWIGILKFIPYEADSIVPFVANSPFMSFFYNDPTNYAQYMNHEGVLNEVNRAWHHTNNTYGYSNGLGIVEILFSLLILAHYLSPKIGFWGATLAFLTPFITLTFLIFTPETWVHGADAHTGFPYLSGAGRLVLKDTMMIATGFVAMVHSAKCIIKQNR